MRVSLVALVCAAAALMADAASACPPPPPGWVPPTREQLLERSLLETTDIAYGIITEAGSADAPPRFKVIHVYKGAIRKGSVLQAPVGWGHPVPQCVGMMGEAPPQPVGRYGVIAFPASRPELNFIAPEDVQVMIKQGWIRSAQAR